MGCLRESRTAGASLGVTGSSIEQLCRTDFCAPKFARYSFQPNHFGGRRISVRFDVGSAEGVLALVD